jgi:hypothetical protein
VSPEQDAREAEDYEARQARLLAPLGKQTYGDLCEPASGRERKTGILRMERADVQVPESLSEGESSDGSRTMNVAVAIVTAVVVTWIVVMAVLISRG